VEKSVDDFNIISSIADVASITGGGEILEIVTNPT
jgi:hypothetical protein